MVVPEGTTRRSQCPKRKRISPHFPRIRRVMSGVIAREEGELAEAISAAIVDLYATFHGHQRTTATTHLNSKIVVCVLESILTEEEDACGV
jgi:Na+-translocating membrane potential-generating system (MpsC)